jgi:predicted ATPase
VWLVFNRLRGRRFYDGFRVDADAPARQSLTLIGICTQLLVDDGADRAATIHTIIEAGPSSSCTRS